jgi:hypothetical protein
MHLVVCHNGILVFLATQQLNNQSLLFVYIGFILERQGRSNINK